MRWWEWLIPNRPMLHRIGEKITTLGEEMALNADELKTRINDATNNIAADVRGLKAKLDQALADQQVVADQAVQEALAGFDTVADSLEAIAAETPDAPVEEPVEGDEPA